MKNSININIILLFLVFLFAPYRAKAQTGYNDIWFHYVSKNMLTPKWSFTFEGTLRFANGLSEKQQYFLRPSIDYKFSKKFSGSLGYSHYETYVYGDPAMNKTTIPEDHVWIQGTWNHLLGQVKITNRLRDENRSVGVAVKGPDGYVIDHYTYRNRVRYMLLATVPLSKKEEQVKWFGLIGDEAFLNIGKFSGATLFNQNRAIIGVGYNLSPAHQLQLNFIHQTIWNFTNTLIENNPTLRISYIQNLSWIKTL